MESRGGCISISILTSRISLIFMPPLPMREPHCVAGIIRRSVMSCFVLTAPGFAFWRSYKNNNNHYLFIHLLINYYYYIFCSERITQDLKIIWRIQNNSTMARTHQDPVEREIFFIIVLIIITIIIIINLIFNFQSHRYASRNIAA